LQRRRITKIINMRVLDQSAGLKNVGNDPEIYQLVLNEYFKENKDTIDNLSLAINEKKYEDAAQIVHKVKGSSGSIGARALYDVSVILQRVLKEEKEDEIMPLQEKFSYLLQHLLEEIMEFLV